MTLLAAPGDRIERGTGFYRRRRKRIITPLYRSIAMANFRPQGLTYDDVLLVPKRSAVASRKHVTTTAQLSRHITLGIPIVSANMDTVTEAPMAVAMARQGGIGIIHRFMSIDQQVRQVQQVKRAQGSVIEQPYTMLPAQTLAEARRQLSELAVSGVLVVDDGRLLGILTARDIRFATDPLQPISTLMTPPERLVTAPPSVEAAQARALLDRHKIEKLPLVDDDGIVRGLITSKDLLQTNRYGSMSRDDKGRLLVGAAIGVVGDYIERAEALWQAGADALVIDIAHGHSDHVLAAVHALKGRPGCGDVIAGNVATAEGTRELIDAGADAVKVGVGPGSICTTRIVTGFGMPQLTAVLECDDSTVTLELRGGRPEAFSALVEHLREVLGVTLVSYSKRDLPAQDAEGSESEEDSA